MDFNMRLTFIGADREVTGSCHYIESAGKHMLIDYGMEQGVNVFENAPLPVHESTIDYVFLTHAHVDHSGLLPLLYANGFRGRVFATEATVDLCHIMLRDCAHIQEQEAEWKNRKAKRTSHLAQVEPLFTMADAEGVIKRLVPCNYNQEIAVAEGVKIRFTDIGHLLGSSSIEVWLKEEEVERKLVFSGDIGNVEQPLIKNPKATSEADYVIMESTYGNRIHAEERPNYVEELRKVLQETFDRGGNVIIPSFAVGRTQEILYFLRKIKEEHLIERHDHFPVYVDSPLAIEATEVFQKNIYDCFDEEAMDVVRSGHNPIAFADLRLSITSNDSKAINFDYTPKVIISASGMCEAGRIRHHLKHNLWRPECTILFVGYQAVGTLGRVIIDGATSVKLFGEQVDIRASINKITGLSGHADKNGLLDWVSGFTSKPRKVFVVHGEDSVCESFVECLREEQKLNAYAPYSGTIFNIATGKLEYEAEGIPIKPLKKPTDHVWKRLLAAVERLRAVAFKNEHGANKDLAKFADQVNSLCDKWDV